MCNPVSGIRVQCALYNGAIRAVGTACELLLLRHSGASASSLTSGSQHISAYATCHLCIPQRDLLRIHLNLVAPQPDCSLRVPSMTVAQRLLLSLARATSRSNQLFGQARALASVSSSVPCCSWVSSRDDLRVLTMQITGTTSIGGLTATRQPCAPSCSRDGSLQGSWAAAAAVPLGTYQLHISRRQ
jgi:hypothetical protein